MADKSAKASLKSRKVIWIPGVFLLSAMLFSGLLYFSLPYLIKNLVPIVVRSEGYAVSIGKVEIGYGIITFEEIEISHAEIMGEIRRLSVEFALWPFGLKEIRLEDPYLEAKPQTSSRVDFSIDKTWLYLLGKVRLIDGKAGLKTQCLTADLTAFSMGPGDSSSNEQNPCNQASVSTWSGRISVIAAGIATESDIRGETDWDTARFKLTSKGEITLNQGQDKTAYELETSGRIDLDVVGVSAEAALFLYDIRPFYPLISGEKTGSDPAGGNAGRSCSVNISSSIKYAPAGDLNMSGKMAFKDKGLSVILDTNTIHGDWQMEASPGFQNGCIHTGFTLLELPVSIKFFWPGENGLSWKAVAGISTAGFDFSNLKGFMLSGQGDITANVSIAPDSWHVSAGLGVKGLSWAMDENHAFEGISLKIGLLADYDGSVKAVSWRGNLEWTEGAALYYPWFLDLSQLAGSLKFSGTLDKKKVVVKEISISGPFELLAGDISFDHSLKDDTKEPFQWKIPKAKTLKASGGLEVPYNVFLREPFSVKHDFLDDLMPVGAWLVELNQDVLHAEITTDISLFSDKFIQGLDLRFSYPISTDSCRSGLLKWDGLTLPLLSSGKTEIPLTVCKGNLKCGPVSMPIDRGEISIEELFWDWTASNFRLKQLKLTGIELKSLWQDPPLPANIEVNIHQGEWIDPRLDIDGEILLMTADGTVRFKDIWIEPFAPMMRFGADVVFSDLDLAQLSDAGQFGHITGKLTGHIHNLIMSGGQPESFELVMENDPKASGRKRISLEAVEKISVLGGGGSIPLFGRMFKEFPYRRIGISCSLKNDLFTLHGLIKKDGQEYLVERGLFRGVNVINRNPEGRISFEDMLDRLKRIAHTEQD